MSREIHAEQETARQIVEALRTLGIPHKTIDIERANSLTSIETPDGDDLGDLVSLGGRNTDEVLRLVRQYLATAVARRALGIAPGGHINHITSLVPFSTASWMAEIHFDCDEGRYALVGEWIVPTAGTPLGWVRDYQLYQAKADHRCDVPGCSMVWYERKVTHDDHCVHVCLRHQEEKADALWMRLHPVPMGGGAQ